jgi:hypothetical protein
LFCLLDLLWRNARRDIHHHVAGPPHGRSRTEIRLGVRARSTGTINRAHAPSANRSTNHVNPDRVLDTWSLHR